jgi:photosystem II stability/assembly factor-like uncharacterized protein
MRRCVHHPALACALACAITAALVLACMVGGSNAATSNVVVSVNVPNATSLTMGGCPSSTPGVTELGVVQPGASAVTSSNCVVGWGSSNNSSMLRAYQSDGTGTAMGAASPTWALRSTQDNAYNFDVAAASGSIAYVASGSAGLRATSNGGGAWTTVAPGGAPNMTAVAVAPGASGTAIASSSNGSIYRTTTTGASWPAETSGTAATLRDLSMVDATNAFAVGDGGVVRVRTTAGSSTWSAGASIGTSPLRGVSAVSTSVVFVVANDGKAARSGNGASSWSTASGCGSLQSVAAFDANNAIAVGYGGTVDLVTWNGTTLTCSGISDAIDVGEDLRSVWVVPTTTTVYAAGVRGTLMKSLNGGTSWTRLSPGASPEFDSVAAPSDGSVWLAGGSGTVARTPDGTTWAVVREGTSDSTTDQDIVALSASSAVTVGGQVDRGGTWQASIRTTTDGGTTWTSRTSNTTESLFSVAAGSPTALVAVGGNGAAVRSTDAGATWTTAATGVSVRLWSVDMVDENTGWAVGDGGTILRTRNGGATWTQQASPVTTSLHAVSAVDENVAFAVGTRGRILRTVDAGATWTSLTGTGTTQALDDVGAADATTVYVAYGYHTFLTSTNANAATPTWTSRSSGSGQDNLSIDVVSRSAIFIGTAWGHLISSIDGGTTWVDHDIVGNNAFLYSVDALDEDTAWTSGNENTVLRTLPAGGSTDIGDYADAGPNWASGGSMFGACLMGTTGAGVTPVWSVDGVCGASGTGIWRGIPASEAAAAAKVAGSSGPVTATASLRFGLRVPTSQLAGRYSAGINFEVVAPDA